MKTSNINIDISNDIKFITSKLLGDVAYLKNKNVLVTGATGFFGIWMLSIFHDLNENYGCNINVNALSRDPENFLKNNPIFVGKINFIKSDIRNFSIGSHKIDYCFHMATTNALETFNNESQINKIDLLYEGTKNLMEQLIKANVKKIIFTSSGVAYGSLSSQNDYIESSVKAPITTDISSALGEGKRLAEYVIAYYCNKHKISFGGEYDYEKVTSGGSIQFKPKMATGKYSKSETVIIQFKLPYNTGPRIRDIYIEF
mgnify:CR=1 FL=1